MIHRFNVFVDVGDMIREAIDTADLTGLGPVEQTSYLVRDSGIEFHVHGGLVYANVSIATDRQEGANAGTGTVRGRLWNALSESDYLTPDAE